MREILKAKEGHGGKRRGLAWRRQGAVPGLRLFRAQP